MTIVDTEKDGAPERSNLEPKSPNSVPSLPLSEGNLDALFNDLIDIEKQLKASGYQQQLEELGL